MSLYDSAASLMYKIVQETEAIDRMSARLRDGNRVFRDISLEKPGLRPAELGLLRAVSWFYVLCNEAGTVNVEFLNERIHVYGVDSDETDDYLALVDRLRTYSQHNLNPSRPRDRDIQGSCETWFREQCGTSEPGDDDQWLCCLIGFLERTLQFFGALLRCIRGIEQDESREQILREWEFRHSRNHLPHEFDGLIAQVAADMGRPSLDAVKLRKRYFEKWNATLDTLQGDYNFEIEARRLIEYAILNETTVVLPITGHDIMEAFEDVEPGPKVGELLKKAKALYEEEPCSRERLLAKLETSVEPLPNTDTSHVVP
jgi:hypothetical protein